MPKFNSHWIERNVYYRQNGTTADGVQRFEQYERPVIVCLCGSTRFKDAWHDHTKRLTREGFIVLGVGDLDWSEAARNENVPLDPDIKVRLDDLHKRKIDLADEVLILNVGGYIGESTARELKYARKGGKTVRFLEKPA